MWRWGLGIVDHENGIRSICTGTVACMAPMARTCHWLDSIRWQCLSLREHGRRALGPGRCSLPNDNPPPFPRGLDSRLFWAQLHKRIVRRRRLHPAILHHQRLQRTPPPMARPQTPRRGHHRNPPHHLRSSHNRQLRRPHPPHHLLSIRQATSPGPSKPRRRSLAAQNPIHKPLTQPGRRGARNNQVRATPYIPYAICNAKEKA